MRTPHVQTHADRLRDRSSAGRALATRLGAYRERDDVVVVALPRGGVPVGFEVARALGAPLDVFVVRKLGAPESPELAIGAIASGGAVVLNHELIAYLGLTPQDVELIRRAEEPELVWRERAYRGNRPRHDVRQKTVIIVDDGLATGATMRVAVKALRALGPARIVVAVPVGSAGACADLRREVDELVCMRTPEPFGSVGAFYDSFAQVSDAEVEQLLTWAAHPRNAAS
jgi:predicted phosphoribosyltransferase